MAGFIFSIFDLGQIAYQWPVNIQIGKSLITPLPDKIVGDFNRQSNIYHQIVNYILALAG